MSKSQAQSQYEWDMYYLHMLDMVKKKSKDPSTKVGAIITKNNKLVSSGFNGFAAGVHDDMKYFPERYERPLKYDFTIHAEMNAILLNAREGGTALDGCTMYVSLHPCVPCANAIVQSGIKRVILLAPSEDQARLASTFNFDLACTVFEEGLVEKVMYNSEFYENYIKENYASA